MTGDERIGMDRRRAIEEAVHNAEMEGAYVSADFCEDMKRYIDGGMSIDDMMARAWRRNNHAGKTTHGQ